MSSFIPNVHKEGYLFIISLFIISCIASAVSWGLGLMFLMLTFSCVAFFRDPARAVPDNDHVILSPADGVVSAISTQKHALHPEEEVYCISIFLSVFNVHVNRIPIAGVIKAKNYRPGKFVSASLDKSSEENEKQVIVLEAESGIRVIVEQIAGFIARRIVCDLSENQSVKSGERFGIIRFGSRVNVFLPKDIKPLVAIGQTVIGGETVLADLEGAQKLAEVNII